MIITISKTFQKESNKFFIINFTSKYCCGSTAGIFSFEEAAKNIVEIFGKGWYLKKQKTNGVFEEDTLTYHMDRVKTEHAENVYFKCVEVFGHKMTISQFYDLL